MAVLTVAAIAAAPVVLGAATATAGIFDTIVFL